MITQLKARFALLDDNSTVSSTHIKYFRVIGNSRLQRIPHSLLACIGNFIYVTQTYT